MPTFTMPDRVIHDDGVVTPLSDSGMPIGGHSQADVLYAELCAAKSELAGAKTYIAKLERQATEYRRKILDLRRELGDMAMRLRAQERLSSEWRCRAAEQTSLVDLAADCIRRLRGEQPLGVREDFDLLATRTPG